MKYYKYTCFEKLFKTILFYYLNHKRSLKYLAKVTNTSMNHQHTLQRKESGCPIYICNYCNQLGCESSYQCLNSNCTYILHTQCVGRIVELVEHRPTTECVERQRIDEFVQRIDEGVQHRPARRIRKRDIFRLSANLLINVVTFDPLSALDTAVTIVDIVKS